jgi:PRTRC genetic system protein E
MLFESLSKLMGAGEHVVFTIQKDGGDRLCVSVQPMLAQGPENPSEAIQQMRAGLAMPLIVRANAQELDGPGFMEALEEYANSRLPVVDGLASALVRVKDGLKGGQNASIEQAAAGRKAVSATTGDDGPSGEGISPVAPAENPESLF